MNNLISPQARLAVAEGRKHHFRFEVIGYGDLPDETCRDEWWTEILESESTIPPEGLPAYMVVKRAGVPIRAVYVQHEAPRLLTGPVQVRKPIQLPKVSGEAAKLIAGAVGLVALAAVTLVGVLVVTAIRIDPVLVVVTEDGSHVEVARWSSYISS